MLGALVGSRVLVLSVTVPIEYSRLVVLLCVGML